MSDTYGRTRDGFGAADRVAPRGVYGDPWLDKGANLSCFAVLADLQYLRLGRRS
jgi:hypothetical protein